MRIEKPADRYQLDLAQSTSGTSGIKQYRSCTHPTLTQHGPRIAYGGSPGALPLYGGEEGKKKIVRGGRDFYVPNLVFYAYKPKDLASNTLTCAHPSSWAVRGQPLRT